MNTVLLASQFPPKNFWLIVGLVIGGSLLVSGLSFWIATRYGGSLAWVTCGMFLGAVIAMNWSIGLLVIGAPLGAMVGCAASILLASFW